MTDNLDTLSDAELNRAFTIEVTGEHFTHGTEEKFCTDANAVLHWLEKAGSWTQDFDPFVPIPMRYRVYLRRFDIEGVASIPARAAVIALIRAKRAQTK